MSLAHQHKIFSLLLLGSIALVISLKTVANLSFFQKSYDPVAMQQKFDMSQWRVPNSQHGISDEELYQVAGYHILQTGEMFEIAPEVPPLGKYIYGYSIILFQNAYYASFLLYLLAIITFFAFTGLFIKPLVWRLLAVLLFATDPLLSIQAYQTMLDIPHLIALLLHMYAMVLLGRHKKTYPIGLIILAGISLGAFAGLKIGFFTVLVLGADCIYLWFKKKLFNVLPISIICGLIYPLLYIPFYLDHHNLIDFLKTQKWVLDFYLSSKAHSLPGMPFISLFTGFIKGWDGRGWERVHEWSFLWPIFGLALLYKIYKLVQTKRFVQDKDLLYLLSMIAVLFGGYLLVPFFARYFTLTLPLMIICLVMLLEKQLSSSKKSV